jgi:hypothetical protein
MGRVSTILRAASGPKRRQPETLSGITAWALEEDLPRVIASWGRMPPQFRQTILSLVEIVEGKQAPVPPSPINDHPRAQ